MQWIYYVYINQINNENWIIMKIYWNRTIWFFFNNLIVGNGKIWTLNVFFKTLKEVPSFLEHSKFFIKITWTDNKFC